jgi:hypothetical protein
MFLVDIPDVIEVSSVFRFPFYGFEAVLSGRRYQRFTGTFCIHVQCRSVAVQCEFWLRKYVTRNTTKHFVHLDKVQAALTDLEREFTVPDCCDLVEERGEKYYITAT